MEKEKAQLMFKLAFSKKNWGAKYDRLEHFKRFQNLDKIKKTMGHPHLKDCKAPCFLDDPKSKTPKLRLHSKEYGFRFMDIIKGLNKIGWLLITKKPGFIGISLNPQFKKEIIEFIELYIPEVKGWAR